MLYSPASISMLLQFKYLALCLGITTIALSQKDVVQNDSAINPRIQTWSENWQTLIKEEHADNLSLAYQDEYVAVYFDSNIDKSTTWPFKPLSDGWKYIQKTFGPIEPKTLYLILHERKLYYGCSMNQRYTLLGNSYSNITVIDCSKRHGNWISSGYTNTFEIMKEVVRVVMFEPVLTEHWPENKVSGFHTTMILLLDLYMGIGRTVDVVRLIKDRVAYRNTSKYDKCNWLYDWHYQIYTRFGKAAVLKKLFSLLRNEWTNNRNTEGGNDRQFNMGELVHFWSGAAGVNLKDLANSTCGWNKEIESEFEKARKEFPSITYKSKDPELHAKEKSHPLLLDENWLGHDHLLFFAHADTNIAVYFDAYMNHSITLPYDTLSRYWHHVKIGYDLIGHSPNPHLHLIFHAKGGYPCQNVWNFAQKSIAKNIIDCGQGSSQAWEKKLTKDMDYVLTEFASIVQHSANQTEKNSKYYWPSMSEIIVLDLYLRNGELAHAYQYLKMHFNEKEVQSTRDIFWLRHWYLHIYTQYGGIRVLNKFFEILNSNRKYINEHKGKLNTGELVHIWSAAAGHNLLEIADNLVNWNEHYQIHFDTARKGLGHLTYERYDFSLPKQFTSNVEMIGACIGAGTGVILIFFMLYTVFRLKLQKLRSRIRQLSENELEEFFEGSPQLSKETANSLIESMPFDMNYEIQKSQLKIHQDQVLGSGEFGLVLRGSITSECEDKSLIQTAVAVKIIKSNVDVQSLKNSLSELKIMSYLGKHKHISSLLGCVTSNIQNRELFIALELCEKGDLLQYLRDHRFGFKDLLDNNESSAKTSLAKATSTNEIPEMSVKLNSMSQVSTFNLLDWSLQISSGMSYISSKKVIHGDLAARNVLLTGNNVAKISDFGLSRQISNYSNYTKKTKTRLPWRWMSIESLRDMQFSTQSDVWSFGVTLFEIFTLGAVPFAGCKWNYEFVDSLVAGLRLKPPKHGNDDIYHIIMYCMREEPEDRIAFEDISSKVHNIRKKLCEQSDAFENGKYSEFEAV